MGGTAVARGQTHDLACAERIRLRVLAGTGRLGAPPPWLIIRVADRIQECCGHRPLKCFRLASGWTAEAAVEHFHRMCEREKLKRRGLSLRSWREWEAGALPGRDYQDLLCRLFSTGPVQLGFARDYSQRTGTLLQLVGGLDLPEDPEALSIGSAGLTYGGYVLPVVHVLAGVSGEPVARTVAEVVMAAARDSARFAQGAEQSNVGPWTLEQLHDDIRSVVDGYPNRPVFPTFLEVLKMRDQVFNLIEGRQRPDQTRDLYLLAGISCGVLANASFDLGHLSAAQTQARTAFLCAELAGSNWLRSWLRGTQSLIAYWDDRFDAAVEYAESAWELVPEHGTARVRLAANWARAHARRGDARAADEVLALTAEARDQVRADDDPGGMFAFPLGKQLYCESSTHLWLDEPERLPKAESTARASVTWYEQAPPEERRLGELCLGRLDLAVAFLARGGLEGAAEPVREVLSVMETRPIESVIRRLRQFDGLLSVRALRTDPLAHTLRSEIEEIRRAPAPALPGGDT